MRYFLFEKQVSVNLIKSGKKGFNKNTFLRCQWKEMQLHIAINQIYAKHLINKYNFKLVFSNFFFLFDFLLFFTDCNIVDTVCVM